MKWGRNIIATGLATLILCSSANAETKHVETKQVTEKSLGEQFEREFQLKEPERDLHMQALEYMNHHFETLEIEDDLRRFGDIAQFSTVALSWSYANNHKDRLEWLKYEAVVTGITQGLKIAVGRPRPSAEGYPYTLAGQSNNSFPSGHTSASFSGAWYLYFKYGFEEAKLPLALATITGISRLTEKRHILSDDFVYYDPPAHHWEDVVAGALIPYFVAKWMVKPGELPDNLDETYETKKFNFFPIVGKNKIGISINPNGTNHIYSVFASQEGVGLGYSTQW